MVWLDGEVSGDATAALCTDAERICVAEIGWLDRVRTATIYRYSFDADPFTPWSEADGQFVAHRPVEPCQVERFDDLLALHGEAGHELRFVPRLGHFVDTVLSTGIETFSFVRLRKLTTSSELPTQ